MLRGPIIHLSCVLVTVGSAHGGAAPRADAGGEGTADGRFDLDPSGFVRQWIVVEPQVRPHYGGRTESGDMPDTHVTDWKANRPQAIALGEAGPFGTAWRYHQSADDIFVQFDRNVPEPSVARMCAAVDLEAPADMSVKARVWIGGQTDLWIGETSLGRHHRSPAALDLPLRKGRNRFVALLQHGGLRGVHLRIGLQLSDHVGSIGVCLPGRPEVGADFERAEEWVRSLRVAGHDRVVAAGPPPFAAHVHIGDEDFAWPQDRGVFTLSSPDTYRCRVGIDVRGQTLTRQFELPAARPLVRPELDRPLAEHRVHLLTRVAEHPIPAHAYFVRGITRRMLGRPPEHDPVLLDEALHRIDRRIDCADFDLAYAVRFIRLGAGTPADHARIKESALRFRHWRDEPGEDGMCFHSENHRLLFHGNQLICGRLWPDAVFTNSGRRGREQAALGRQRCIEWLDEIERSGYEEFLSTTYAPITVGALMNLVDFADDPAISERAARQMDKIYRMLARHTFDGVMIGPQGRAYRYMLYPQYLGTQALLSWATPRAIEAANSWAIFVASSPRYQPPEDVAALMDTPVQKRYREGYGLIDLLKTSDFMLSSIEIPASAKDPSFTRQLVPGGHGYQQHIWHAALAADCHVFTNHPGSTHDLTSSRPGFWAGSAIMPRQTQRGNVVMQIFAIPEDCPIQFTHAHWPSDTFDRQELQGHWAFGRRRTGFIGLWCSTKPELRSEVLTDRELRAWGSRTAWVCICSGQAETADFEAFMASCRELAPRLDPEALVLSLSGQQPLRWNDGPTAP